MRRICSVLILLTLFSAAWAKTAITPPMSMTSLPGDLEGPDISYRGVFEERHIFVSSRENAIYLFPVSGEGDTEKFFFRRGSRSNEILSPALMTTMGNRIWIGDSGNRVSVFEYNLGRIRLLYTAYIPEIQVISALYAGQEGLFVFGRDMEGEFRLCACDHNGSGCRTIEKFGKTIPGNIIMGSGPKGSLHYLFEFDSRCRTYHKGKKRSLKIPLKIRYSAKEHRRSGIIYNIGTSGEFTYITYWTVKDGGILLILKNGKTHASMDYPMGKGFFHDGNLYIHRFSFKDKKQISFVVEVKTSSTVKERSTK